eukprot:UN07551
MDQKKYPKLYSKIEHLLTKLPKNVKYLLNESFVYKGIKFYGCPYTQCRMEMYNKSNGSDAFERTKVERSKIYKTIPLDIDILLTHCPPENMLCDKNVGDPLLAEILVNFKKSEIYR